MFEPQFTYTNKIVDYIAKIASAKEIIINAKLIPLYDTQLKQEALIKSSHYSTSIEGNPLKLEEVKTLINNNQEPTTKAEQEVLNYFNVLNNLNRYSDKIVTKNTILSVHKDLTKGLLRDSEYEGKFRDTKVFVGNLHTKEINYMPPDAYKVPYLVDELLDWLNNSTDEIYPIIIAGILHYELVRIHPFIDGNGRTSRLMATLILSIHKFNIYNYFTLDEYYNQDRQAYVDALKSADKNHDLTNWLEYFCYGVLYSIDKVKSEVLSLAQITSKYDNAIKLTPNEISVLTLLEEKNHIQNKDIQKLLNISPQASYKIIKKLKDKKIIESTGKGRNTEYILK
ncbi:adenosine monophosphate-protein transferase SoFic [Methanobrevibacter oralis]|uniref:Adenosine monophosphate-protein transferase SoFic n=1 Tax=Methanobrevibacter oralis TaxID=66851 RepID=A0A166AUC7_METOA|nr:Fic family protein [Methanobrevibacter oralis]KZX12483.1 adenosine monophosphate-protein transferase SoFic [Methanobrevibacter oralis]